MSESNARNNILHKIRQALTQSVPLPFPGIDETLPVFPAPAEDLDVIFAQEFTKLQGRFAFCFDEADLYAQLDKLIADKEWLKIWCSEDKWNEHFSNTINLAGCHAAITGCELLVARTGSIVLSAAEQSGRTVSVYAPIHICIAYSNQLVYDVKDALQLMKDKYADQMPSMISFASGPSRTADIEKTLVTGVHGPKEVYLFLVDSPI